MKKLLILFLILLLVFTAFISGCKKATPAAEPAESETQDSGEKVLDDNTNYVLFSD